MYKINFLTRENDLNKIIKNHKREQGDFSILFVSLWDDYCEKLVQKLVEAHSGNEEGKPLYVVDSFNMPHSFVIYKTSKVPHLVNVSGRGIQSEDYLPMIMKTLLPEKQKKKRSK
jgi:hypothetical protein